MLEGRRNPATQHECHAFKLRLHRPSAPASINSHLTMPSALASGRSAASLRDLPPWSALFLVADHRRSDDALEYRVAPVDMAKVHSEESGTAGEEETMAKEKKCKHELHKMIVEEAQKNQDCAGFVSIEHLEGWVVGIQLEGGLPRLAGRRRQAWSV